MRKLATAIIICLITGSLYAQKISPDIGNDIKFASRSSKIFSSSFPVLDKLAIKMRKDTTICIKVAALADTHQGRDEYNTRISLGRADAIKNYLKNKGINEQRVKIDTLNYSMDETVVFHNKNKTTKQVIIKQIDKE